MPITGTAALVLKFALQLEMSNPTQLSHYDKYFKTVAPKRRESANRLNKNPIETNNWFSSAIPPTLAFVKKTMCGKKYYHEGI